MNRSPSRRIALLALVAGALAAPALATDERVEISLLVAPGGVSSASERFEASSTWGLGAGLFLSRAWSLELRGLASQGDTDFATYDQRSFELGVRRAIGDSERWRPFVQAGARYREADAREQVFCTQIIGPCPIQRHQSDDLGPFLGAGVDWRFARVAALRLDGRLAAYEDDATNERAEDFDFTAGVVFRF